MMEFNVKRKAEYMELTVITEDADVRSGLLDKGDALYLAKELIYSAEKLLPEGVEDIKQRLCDAREEL